MEDKEIDENISLNGDAPPVPINSDQINNAKNNINNKIRLNESNFNLFPNNFNDNIKIKDNSELNSIKNNGNIQLQQNPFINMNNYFQNNYQHNLLSNQFYLPNYNGINYKNNIKLKMEMNNLYNPYSYLQNYNNNNISDSNLYDLKLDLKSEFLNNLSKEYLIDIILYVRDVCKIKIPSNLYNLKHEIFKVKKNKYNECKFYIKCCARRRLKIQKEPENKNDINNQIENGENSDENSDEAKNIIINENN